MAIHTQSERLPSQSSALSAATGGVFQRQCACGNHADGEECAECRGKAQTVQRASQPLAPETRRLARNFSLVPARAGANNPTGIPDRLIAGLEQLSGVDLSGVRVHYNSAKPAQLNALAYTRGREIQIAPGQEKYLPHEGWHVVQQMKGRVVPTAQLSGIQLNNDDALEREADVMGAKARVLGCHAQAGFRTRITAAEGAGPDDEPFVTGMRAVTQGSVIQRVANFVAGTVNATTNMASHLIAGNRSAGFTPPTLNGTTTMSAAAAQGAIKAPTLGGRSNADGTVDTWVSAVLTNEASYTMQVPSAGPWSTVTPKVNVAALFASIGLASQAGCSTGGGSTFRVNGKPSDADFAANVRTHENLHVADHRTGFTDVIGAWDTKLETARAAKTMFNGATVAAAEAALFTAMGGTASQVATAQFTKWVALNDVTHAGKSTVATGGTATPSNSAADATCSTSSMDVT